MEHAMTLCTHREVVRFLQYVRELQQAPVDFACQVLSVRSNSLIEQRLEIGMRVAPVKL